MRTATFQFSESGGSVNGPDLFTELPFLSKSLPSPSFTELPPPSSLKNPFFLTEMCFIASPSKKIGSGYLKGYFGEFLCILGLFLNSWVFLFCSWSMGSQDNPPDARLPGDPHERFCATSLGS